LTHAEPTAHALPASAAVRPGAKLRRLAAVFAPALLALASSVVFLAAAPLAARTALFLHLGSVVAAGRGFNVGWLGALALHAADALGGYAGAATLGALELFALTAFVYARARSRAGAVLALGAALFALLTCFDAARLSGIATAWLGAAAFLYALDRAPRRSAWFAPLIALVWCNASPTGLLAPVLAVLVAFGRIAEARDVTAARPYWPFAFAAAAATLLTPGGFAYPFQALAALHLDPQFARILPIAPGTAAPHVFRIAATLVVVAAAWLWAGRRRAADAPLVLAAFTLCFFDGGFVPLLGIVAGPAFAAAASGREEIVAPPARAEALGAGLSAVFVVLAGLIILPHAPTRAWTNESPLPLLEGLSARGGTHVVFCSTIAWCDYAETLPGLRPFLDERVEHATFAQLQAQEKIGRARPGWHQALRENGIDAILVPRDAALVQLVPSLRGWKLAGSDVDARLFVREAGAR
jgi:hypothetical protein